MQLSYLGGAENPADNRNYRHLLDLVLALHGAWGGVKLEALGLLDQQGRAAAHWRGGILAAARLNFGEAFGLALRGEYVDASSSIGLASLPTANSLASDSISLSGRSFELTLTPSYNIYDNVVVQLEGRYDRRLATPSSTALASSTVLANLLFVL